MCQQVFCCCCCFCCCQSSESPPSHHVLPLVWFALKKLSSVTEWLTSLVICTYIHIHTYKPSVKVSICVCFTLQMAVNELYLCFLHIHSNSTTNIVVHYPSCVYKTVLCVNCACVSRCSRHNSGPAANGGLYLHGPTCLTV